MSYKHITSFQRNELSALLRAGIKKKDIATLLNKDRISIWRELKKMIMIIELVMMPKKQKAKLNKEELRLIKDLEK